MGWRRGWRRARALGGDKREEAVAAGWKWVVDGGERKGVAVENCAQCSMRSDDQKAHIEESMCVCARECHACACVKHTGGGRGGKGEKVGGWFGKDRRTARCAVCAVHAHPYVLVAEETHFDESVSKATWPPRTPPPPPPS